MSRLRQRFIQERVRSSTSPCSLGKSVSTKAGSCSGFSPQPTHQRFIADAEGELDATDAHAVLVGAEHLVFEALVVGQPLGLQNERAPARQALGTLRSVAGVAVLADLLAAATGTNVGNSR